VSTSLESTQLDDKRGVQGGEKVEVYRLAPSDCIILAMIIFLLFWKLPRYVYKTLCAKRRSE
jgi:hypothetical protein